MEALIIANEPISLEKPVFWTKNSGFGSPVLEAPDAMTVFEFDDFRAYLEHMRTHYPGMRRPITPEQSTKA